MKATTTTTTIATAITITIKEHIINFTKGKYYFHINDLEKHLIANKVQFKQNTLKQNLYFLKKDGIIFEAGKGWYSTIKGTFELETKPIEEIVSLIKDKFPLLEFSCWSTEQLKEYFQHLLSQFVGFVYADKDFLQYLKDFLIEKGYSVYLNPRKNEVKKYVELKNQAVILRPLASSRKPEKRFMASVEKILVDLFFEIKKISLMDVEEYKKIASNIILSHRINIAEMFDYAERRKIRPNLSKLISEVIQYTNATIL